MGEMTFAAMIKGKYQVMILFKVGEKKPVPAERYYEVK
jgi:hypothetical protein